MIAARIPVRPVDNAASIIPLVFTIKGNGIATPERLNSWRQIDIVGDKQCPPWREFNDESLMATTFVVVGKNSDDRAAALDLVTGAPLTLGRCGLFLRGCAAVVTCGLKLLNTIGKGERNQRNYELLHLANVTISTPEVKRPAGRLVDNTELQR